jgi:hypothetical protein
MSPDEYRRHAAECLRLAESVAETQYRASLAALAQSWLLLAHQAEKNLITEIVYETPEPRQHVAQQQQQPQLKTDGEEK